MSEIMEPEPREYQARRLKETLELEGSPVAVAIAPEPPEGLKPWKRRSTPCIMIQSARRGASFYSPAASVVCGARAHLGMGKPLVTDLEDFLVRRERLAASREAAHRMLASTQERAPSLGEYLLFSPLEKAAFVPQVVLFVATPLQVGRLIFLDAFETGSIDTVHGEPLCSGAIAAPLATGKIGLSFMDVTCRVFGRYKPEEMVAGVPYNRLPRIVASIDQSIAGTAEPGLLIKLLPRFIGSRKAK